jgi:hypothetical protein
VKSGGRKRAGQKRAGRRFFNASPIAPRCPNPLFLPPHRSHAARRQLPLAATEDPSCTAALAPCLLRDRLFHDQRMSWADVGWGDDDDDDDDGDSSGRAPCWVDSVGHLGANVCHFGTRHDILSIPSSRPQSRSSQSAQLNAEGLTGMFDTETPRPRAQGHSDAGIRPVLHKLAGVPT